VPLLVPDASVLLKWALPGDDEPDRDRALQLKEAWLEGSCDLMVPTLWVFEVGNVLGLKRPADAGALLEAMIALELPEAPPGPYASGIFGLMRANRVTFYDAAYHALAVHRRGTMLTADRAYVRKAGRAGHVQLIDAWRPRT
jgi:predicted nucleic acid-binding protein